MKTCFAYMFWGLLVVAAALVVNAAYPLPAWVETFGYFLLAVGIGGLAGLNGNLIVACCVSWLLVVMSAASTSIPGHWITWYRLAMTLLNCVTIWTLCGGISELAVTRHRSDLARLAAQRRVLYVGVTAAMAVLGLAIGGTHAAPQSLAVVIAVVELAATVLVLQMLHRVPREFNP